MHRGVSTCVLTPRAEFDESFGYYHTDMSQNPRQPPRPRPVSHWLSRLGDATPAAQHAARLAEAALQFQACLPRTLAGEAVLANIHGTTWICIAHHGAIAHKIRLIASDVVGCLRGRGINVSEIRVDVRARAPAPPAPPKRAVLSTTARQSLATLAEQLSDTDVGGALRRLLDRQAGTNAQTTRTRRSKT